MEKWEVGGFFFLFPGYIYWCKVCKGKGKGKEEDWVWRFYVLPFFCFIYYIFAKAVPPPPGGLLIGEMGGWVGIGFGIPTLRSLPLRSLPLFFGGRWGGEGSHDIILRLIFRGEGEGF